MQRPIDLERLLAEYQINPKALPAALHNLFLFAARLAIPIADTGDPAWQDLVIEIGELVDRLEAMVQTAGAPPAEPVRANDPVGLYLLQHARTRRPPRA